MKKVKLGVVFLASVLMTCLLCFKPFYSLDRRMMDRFYQRPITTNNKIKIIGIDEKTLKELGTFGTWSRDVYGTLIDKICEKADPAIIGFDITFKSDMDKESDDAFAKSAALHDVVIANSVVFEKDVNVIDDSLEVNPLYVNHVEETYASLQEVTTQGFSNASLDNDGVVRKSILYTVFDNKVYKNFAYEVVDQYAKKNQLEFTLPTVDDTYRFGIKYSGKVGNYEKISFIDVLNGKVDSRIFDDCIVLVGAYASGMQDAYYTPIQSNQKMYGVEIQANIVDSLLSGRYYEEIRLVYVVMYSIIVYIIFILIMMNLPLFRAILVSGLFLVGHVLCCMFLNTLGYEMPILDLFIGILVSCIVYVIVSYCLQKMKSKHIESVLKKYVAPQVVDEVMKEGTFDLQPGGVMKDIAVLFVDIRGFTTLSEQVEPNIVVEILNKYLGFTTQMIFNNRGTLDKFIGDATMAVFNSPVDLEDYEYLAVKTALDIAKGSEEINRFTKENFNVSVGFGVGVHCGKAVIGNIGSSVRMDYTAIGDTVNTASRLEGKSKAGQVLVSKEIVERLKDRVQFNFVGEMELKGKMHKMEVYEVVGLKEG